ncbi:MAG TPA: caspase family protein, partial [Phnomibacter sp.]|nr:caspase family protein [Phnomibacter sp.]
ANAASGQPESYYLLSAEFSGEQNVAQYSFTLKTLKQLTDQLPCKDQLIVFDTGLGEVIRRDFNTNFFSSDPVTASATRKNRLVLCAEKTGSESKDTADGKLKGDIVRIITSMPAGNNITQLFTGKDAPGDLRYKLAMTALWNAQRCCYATVQLLSENDYLQTLLHISSNFGNAKRSTMTRPAATEKKAAPSAAALMEKRRKHAIIIASNQYQAGDLWLELVTPGNDAKEVAGILKQQYGYDTTLLWNPGKKDILRVIDEIVYNEEANPYSQYIIYFAGHGYWASNRKLGYIVPNDAMSLTDPLKPASQELDTYLDYATLFGMLNQLNKVLLITDVCFGGTSFNSLLGRQNEVDPDKDEANKAINPYRLIMASGIKEVDDYVRLHDGSVSKHSPFANDLIEVLKGAKGKLSVETLFALLKNGELSPTPVSRQFGTIIEPNEFKL